jgi:hypothetical protein
VREGDTMKMITLMMEWAAGTILYQICLIFKDQICGDVSDNTITAS